MKFLFEKIRFLLGMSSDITPEDFPKGASPYRFNVRVLSTNDNSEGAVTTVNGNTLVTFTLPTGVNKCIGYCEDKLNQKGYAFILNTSNSKPDKHSILEFDSLTNTIAYVYRNNPSFDTPSNALNFQLGWLITGCAVVELDSDNPLLYWTDGYINPLDASDYNEPKKINIRKGKLYMSSSGTDIEGYVAPFNSHWIDRIKEYPPAPTYTWSGGLPVRITQVLAECIPNFIIGSETDVVIPFPVASPNLPPPVSGQWDVVASEWTCPATGFYTISVGLYVFYNNITVIPTNVVGTIQINSSNYLTQTVHFDGTPAQIQIISMYIVLQHFTAGDTLQVFARQDTDPAFTEMQIAHYNSNFSNVSIFFNGTTLVDTSVINNNFQRLFQFQNAYGYDDKEQSVLSKKTDYILPETVQVANTSNENFSFQQNEITIRVWSGGANVKKIFIYVHEIGMIDNTETAQADIALVVELDKESLGIDDNIFYDYPFLNDGNYIPISIEKKNQLFDFIFYYEKALAVFKDRMADANGAEGVNATRIDLRLSATFDQKVETNTNIYFPKRSYVKPGGIYQYSINYEFNGGRLGNANTTIGNANTQQSNGYFGSRLSLPFNTQDAYTCPLDETYYVPIVFGWVYSRPPKDAIRYSIGRSKNQAISSYIQFTSQNAYYTDSSGVSCPFVSAVNFQLDLNNITGVYKDENGASQLVYEWTKGDRVRLIAPRSSENNIYTFYNFNDNETVGLFNGILEVRMSQTVPDGLAIYKNILFEVYTPAKTIENDNELVYEVGETGTIGEDRFGNKVHIPDDNGKTSSAQEIGTFQSSNYNSSAHTMDCTCVGGDEPAIGDNVKIVGIVGGKPVYSIYGVVTASSAGAYSVDTTGFVLWGTFASSVGECIKCSEQEFISGDCFFRMTDMPYKIQPANTDVERLEQYTQTMNASNMYPSEAWDYGRPNRIDNDAKRSENGAMVRFTQQFIPNTNINGLSTIFDLSFQTYAVQYGGIMFLFYQNERLIAFQKLKTLPILVLQQNLQSPSGDGFVGTSQDVLSPQQKIDYYLEDFGIGDHPESFASYANRKYFFDVRRCGIIRLSQDGLINISDEAKMNVFIADLCAKILKSPTHVNCVGIYDERFGEYILMVEPFDYRDGHFDGCTLAFNEMKNQFSTFYGYQGDYGDSNGIDILTFKAGSLYTHNTNDTQNNFYGVQQSSEAWVYCNDYPSAVKVFTAIALEGLQCWEAYEIITPGQLSELLVADFVQIEKEWNGALLFDKNTPGVEFPIMQGDTMRGVWCLYKLRYNGTTFNKLFAVDARYIPSNLHYGRI